MKHTVLVSVGLVLALLTAGAILWQRQIVDDSPDNKASITGQNNEYSTLTETNERIDTKLREELSQLRQDIASLKTDMQLVKDLLSNTKAGASITHKPEARNSSPRISRTKNQAIEGKQAQEFGMKLDEKFSQQSTDTAWSAQTQATIKNVLNEQKIAGDDVISLECRADSCRLELANDENNSPADLSELSLKLGQNLPFFFVDNRNSYDENANTTVVYFSSRNLSE